MSKTAAVLKQYRGDSAELENAPLAVAGLAIGGSYAPPLPATAQPSRTTRPRRDASEKFRARLDGHPRPGPPKLSPPERNAGIAAGWLRLRGYLTGSSAFLWPFIPALLAWGLIAVAASSELPRIDERDWPRQESVTFSPSD
jgi:hypothetical protein